MTELFRIFQQKTKKYRDIEAKDADHAIEISGWKRADCQIRVKTNNGCGGWKKVK